MELFGDYSISLGDGSQWEIRSDAHMKHWLELLAGILEISPCGSKTAPKLIFSVNNDKSNSTCHPEIRGAPLNNGWKCHDLNTLCVWYHDDIPDVICEVKPFDKPEAEIVTMWNALYPIYQKSISRGGLPFHAGLVEFDGRGVLLAAPGNTGKSTSCNRMPDYWNVLCDDETLVVLDNKKNLRAHPFPSWSDYLWRGSGKTWNVQYSVPVCGVFFLEQSETDEVIPLGKGKAAVYMNESATQVCRKFWRRADEGYQRTFRRTLFNNACEMAKQIPVFRLHVSLHGRFWRKMEGALGW